MLRRLALRDFVIVDVLDIELREGFTVLTGETGAGKSILIDALQLALGSRGDASVVREGASRAEIVAEFDRPASADAWLDQTGIDPSDTLLIKRTIDQQGRSRIWVNGSVVTLTQVRELAEWLVDIHGQHAWQSLMRPEAVRGLLDAYAGIGVNEMQAMQKAWSEWRQAVQSLEKAQQQRGDWDRERERLQWQISEVEKLAPGADEWSLLNEEHSRLAHAQSILDATQKALENISQADMSADGLTTQAIEALQDVVAHDARLQPIIDVLMSAQAQLEDAAHTLTSTLRHTDLDPDRLQQLDERLGSWMSQARRWRTSPQELPKLWHDWQQQLSQLDAAVDVEALEKKVGLTLQTYREAARVVSERRKKAAPQLSSAITTAMQSLGMPGGQFLVQLHPSTEPQAYGMESAEFLVAGHEGSTPRALSKVASGGELSRISLAIAVTTSRLGAVSTVIFDEIDSGVGGAVAHTVGQLMRQLGQDRQVLAVTHLPQVAASATEHFVVSKRVESGQTRSQINGVTQKERVHEIARMLGGAAQSGASVAHAQEMLEQAAAAHPIGTPPSSAKKTRQASNP